MERDKIDRINALAKKSKMIGLNEEEKEEQHRLRQEYIGEFRKSMETTLDSITITDRQGNKVKIKKKALGSNKQQRLQ